jgi:hypothetical protein
VFRAALNLARPAALLLVAAVATACVGTAGAAAPSASPSPNPPSDKVVFRVDADGGFVPPGFLLRRLPLVVVYADGRVVTPGPMIEIWPAPLVPALQVRTLTPEALARLIDLAGAKGLTSDAHYDFMAISDATTTVLTVTVDGKTATVSAYALNEAPDDAAPGMTAEERQGRANLSAFLDALLAVPEGEWADEGSILEPEAIRVYATPYVPDPAADWQSVEWPLDDLATAGDELENGMGYRCQVIEGDDLAEVMPLLEGANEQTPFRSGGADYTLIVRPLLPGESGC